MTDGALPAELREVLARAGTPAAVLDASGAVVWSNPALERLLPDVTDLSRTVGPHVAAPNGRTSTFQTDEVDGEGRTHRVSWTSLALGGPGAGCVVIGHPDVPTDVHDEGEARFKRLVEQIPAATYIDQLEGPTLYMSPQVEQITGYTSEEWIADSTLWERRLLHPADRARMLAKDDAAAELLDGWADEYRIVAKDGSVRWVAERAQVLPGRDGQPHLLQGVMFDVTEQREVLARLRDAEARYRLLVEAIPAVVYIDPFEAHPAVPLYVSPRAERMFGYPMRDWDTIPDLWTQLLHPEDRAAALMEGERALEAKDTFRLDYRVVTLSGETRWIHDEAIPVQTSDGSWHWQGFMLDITEQKEAEGELAHLAYHDRLTGLPSRQRFEEELERALHRAGRNGGGVGVLSIGLDLFRLVNESFGHDAGDQVLRDVVGRLGGSVRTTDLFARRGGDEFLVLLEDLDPTAPETAALQAAGRFREQLREPFDVQGVEVFVSATIGVSLLGVDATDAEELLRHADAARVRGKSRGPGTVTAYREDDDTDRTPEERLRFASKLRRAVEQEPWVLHYQPVIDLRTRAVVGAEALVRWEDPEHGLVPPGEFIPLAETLGLIEPIGRWVVDEVCRQQAAWAADHLPVRVSVNLSPREFLQPDLAGRIFRQLRISGAAPSSIVAEISESAALDDAAHTATVVAELRAGGVGLAVNDFGTGSSSLSRLMEIRPDQLKIDRSLVGRLPGTEQDRVVVRAMLTLAEMLGLTAVAIGIETVEQERFLIENGCTLGQGFLLGRPMPADRFTELLRTTQEAVTGP